MVDSLPSKSVGKVDVRPSILVCFFLSCLLFGRLRDRNTHFCRDCGPGPIVAAACRKPALSIEVGRRRPARRRQPHEAGDRLVRRRTYEEASAQRLTDGSVARVWSRSSSTESSRSTPQVGRHLGDAPLCILVQRSRPARNPASVQNLLDSADGAWPQEHVSADGAYLRWHVIDDDHFTLMPHRVDDSMLLVDARTAFDGTPHDTTPFAWV